MASGSEKRARNETLTFRLTAEEKASIVEKATRKGLEPGSYAREVLLGAPMPRQVRRPPIERRELSRLLGEVGKIGSNLNQLARAANMGAAIYASEIMVTLAGVRLVSQAILKALGRSNDNQG